MINIGINGLGRIGKCIFLQLLDNINICVKAINIPDFDINMFENYIKTDSNHHYNKNFDVEIVDDNKIKINNNLIVLFNNRCASNLFWNKLDIEYVIDATGVYLTKEKALQHNVPYFIMCAPPKDTTPQFMVSANEHLYNGENIVSNASCTSNALIPIVKFLNDKYKIVDANFNTIHSATASQKTTDTTKLKKRTCRSIINNIIPHTTGASKSVEKILPELKGKIFGASVRVPVSNVSLINLNVSLKEKTNLENILLEMEKTNYIIVNRQQCMVSSDYMTTTCPCIIDANSCMNMSNNKFKIMIWYDNEWSYSNKVIKLLEHMISVNNFK
tara:strand:+ start:188 stop:1177 length:990 start_codon:yes stop_codon:yes gene_type:complete